MSNYPKRFEILKNNGKTLEFRVDQLANGIDKCFVKHFVNDIDQRKTRQTKVPKILEYDIEESGKHTFVFFEYDPNIPFDALSDGIDLGEDNGPIWEQDVFVMKHDPNGLSKRRIEYLATKYAPFVFLHEDERFLPTSLEYLLNKDEEGKTKDESLKVMLTLKFHNIKIKDIDFPYNDLFEVIPYNGEKNSVLNTIGFDFFADETQRDILEKRKKDPGNVTIYYSCIPNPEKPHQIIISYHFLYAYDSKQEKEGDTKFASHIFDRESVNIVFNWDRNNRDEDPKPEYMIYGAHLEGQTMGSVKQDENDSDKWNNLQRWTSGRVKVKWNDVIRIKENHPCITVAKGSHAPYPAPGHYAVYMFGDPLVEPAGTHKVLIHEDLSLDNATVNEINEVYSYKLKDLGLDAVTSKSILAYSGYIVDIIGFKNAKFPPFTNRELEIDKWVNGDADEEIYDWIPSKVEEGTRDRFASLIGSINNNLA